MLSPTFEQLGKSTIIFSKDFISYSFKKCPEGPDLWELAFVLEEKNNTVAVRLSTLQSL